MGEPFGVCGGAAVFFVEGSEAVYVCIMVQESAVQVDCCGDKGGASAFVADSSVDVDNLASRHVDDG